MNRWLPAMLVAMGVLLLLYPSAKERYYDWKQEKLLSKAMAEDASPAPSTDLASASRQLTEILEQPESEPLPKPTEVNSAGEEEDPSLAIIEIKAIDLKLPVLEGATKANMKVAAAHMTETSAIGEPGNAAIAAHRAHTTGRLFNRLGEVVIGDSVVIRSGGKVYEYQVYRITVVKPTDLSVLEPDGDLETLTLITCDPLVNPTHRLIVQAKRVYGTDT